ncbi:MAG: hypothetical protein QXT46_07235 [Pyrobaculum sp.]
MPVEVPIVLGRRGVERVLEIELTEDEREKFNQSVEAVKKLISTLPQTYK